MNGIFLINKPSGMTSHDVVFKIKKKFNLKKVGHTGTLDPFATGLLIIMVGNATKLSFLFDDLDKAYSAVMILNEKYDTYDITGNLVEKKDIIVSQDKLKNAIHFYNGLTYDQKPPMYSAIKIKGQKMYDLARKGIEVDIPKRNVTIYQLKQTSELMNNEFSFDAHVSKGTYIRSLALDIALKVNTVGTLKELNRTQIGTYFLKDAKSIDEVTEKDLITDQSLLEKSNKLELSPYLIKLVKNGVYLDERQIVTEEPFIVVDQNKQWIAYYDVVEKNTTKYKPVYFF
ncbi:tRNA pseudouridine synthase B [Alteracholeplasma palmae J233]|uniref:tRNA pseudouridine synthase B n=1 Tax=Alteracholeplasma palmae (strain ATCC 49389 / J233) TaxID=1318466 RepID=U4KKZ4_ALTPJ|nr:tRNA pseudouridine(55) synthase TruB [Alteracholeplasma palmae]CCV64504.1 tRNA pseudouridine synthase B [Alteracholeplasma palmae J233]